MHIIKTFKEIFSIKVHAKSMRFYISPTLASIVISIYLLLIANNIFWQFLDAVKTTTLIKIQMVMTMIIMNFSFCSFLIIPYLWRILLSTLLIASIIANYYMSDYGVILDKSMMLNVINTDVKEVLELLTFRFFIAVVPKIIFPLVLIFYCVKIKFERSFFKYVGFYSGRIFIALLLILALFSFNSKDIIGFFRKNGEDSRLRFKVVPLNIFAAGSSIIKAKLHIKNKPFFCNHARVSSFLAKNEKPVNVIFVIGESTRSGNMSLNGYQRKTNPLLEKVQDLVVIKDVLSCGTSTAHSVPCIFSKLKSDEFNPDNSDNITNLLDVAAKVGFAIKWYDNNQDSYGVARRHAYQDLPNKKSYDAQFFNILETLKQDMSKENTFIVLHTIGSHGPAYYERVPTEFKKFSPFCSTSDFLSCTREEVINAYDNTILYLDYFLFNLISSMKEIKSDVLIIYISDHGESLGENRIYLHGWPLLIAPKEQRLVPMIVWINDSFAKSHRINKLCMKDVANRKTTNKDISQDNVFHTVLGLLRIETQDRDDNLNIFKQCEIMNE